MSEPLLSEILFRFIVFYPVSTAALWMAGGLLYRMYEERSRIIRPTKGWPGVTVLVPAYNEEGTIASCIAALRQVDYPQLEILILNDGSKDGTVAVATAAAGADPRVQVVDDGTNMGKADRLNDGFRRASHDLVFVTDADTHLHPEALKFLVARIEHSPRIAAVAGSPHVTNRENLIEVMQVLEALSLIGLMRRTYAVAGRVGTVAGVLGLFRRPAVLEVGGYDPKMATEDIDLSWRLLLAGYRTDFEANAVVGMQVPESLRPLWAQRTRWARGQGEVLRKHAFKLLRPRHFDLWPIAVEAIVSLTWVVLLVGSTVWNLVEWAFLDQGTRVHWMLGWGVAIAVVAVAQLTVASAIALPHERRLGRYFVLAPIYPLAYWLVNALAALRSELIGLAFGPRRKRVIWNIERPKAPAPHGPCQQSVDHYSPNATARTRPSPPLTPSTSSPLPLHRMPGHGTPHPPTDGHPAPPLPPSDT